MALYAYPVLKKYRFHAVAFVVTGWLNTHHMPFDPARSVCLTEIDLYSMTDVFEYANHTDRFHTRSDEQTSILMTAGDNEFAEDLRRCSANPLIRSKDVFAYPFDLYSGRNTDLLRSSDLSWLSPAKTDETAGRTIRFF
jgi:peptidoglycan/xylan/chitin deacetylase (PgdA/CDA1 family)